MNAHLISAIADTICEGDRERAKAYLVAQRPFIDVLLKMLDRYEDQFAVRECNYEVGSWAYLQAHMNGKREATGAFKALLRTTHSGDPTAAAQTKTKGD